MNKRIFDLIGKCGFYCVDEQNIDYCGLCENSPCKEIMIREKATVLDPRWLEWKRLQRDNEK